MLNELHPVEGPELSKVTAEEPEPLGCGHHTVPPSGVYIKGEEETKKRKKRRGEKERDGKKAGDRLSGKRRQRESIRGRRPQSSLDGPREEEGGEGGAGPAHARPRLRH